MIRIRAHARLALALALGVATAAAGLPAAAATFTFDDTAKFWPGEGNGSGDDGVDTVGGPDLIPTPGIGGGRFEVTGGVLTSVEIDFLGPFTINTAGNGVVVPGDLFLDSDNDKDWDYVLKVVSGANTSVVGSPVDLLDVSAVAPSYLESGTDNTGYWSGFLVRDSHPYAWAAGGLDIGDGSLAAFSNTASTGTLVFDLGAGVNVGDTFVIGFAPNCANDVIYEVVPEPGTLVLLFAGLSGIAFAGRRAA